MNVEGDFRYVDSGGFDECSDFLEYLNDYEYKWQEAFVGWVGLSKRWKEDRRMSKNYWGPLNLVKVLYYYFASFHFFSLSLSLNIYIFLLLYHNHILKLYC